MIRDHAIDKGVEVGVGGPVIEPGIGKRSSHEFLNDFARRDPTRRCCRGHPGCGAVRQFDFHGHASKCRAVPDNPGVEILDLRHHLNAITQLDPDEQTTIRRPQRIFDAVREVVTESGLLAGKTRRALDSTVLDDAVARQDTITMLIARPPKDGRPLPSGQSSFEAVVATRLDDGCFEGGRPWAHQADFRRAGRPVGFDSSRRKDVTTLRFAPEVVIDGAT